MPIKDPARLVALMSLVEKVTTVAPRMTNFISEAMAELEQAHEDIRRTKQKEQGQPVTPDPAVQGRTVTRAEGGDPIPAHPEPSTPVKKDVDVGTKPPPVDKDEPNRPKVLPATHYTSDDPNPKPMSDYMPNKTLGPTDNVKREVHNGAPGPAESTIPNVDRRV